MEYRDHLHLFVEPLPFEDMMARAQRLHAAGQVELAAMAYGLATTQAPNDSEFGRALRGQAVGLYRYGEGQHFGKAFQLAQAALRIHTGLVEAAPDDPAHRDMRLESARVAARMALGQTVRRERHTSRPDPYSYLEVGRFLDMALTDLSHVAADSQHAKNFYPFGAIALALMPDEQRIAYVDSAATPRELARLARSTALSAESPGNATSARLGWPHRARSVAMATYRAAAASAIVALATPEPSAKRRQAVRVATMPWVL